MSPITILNAVNVPMGPFSRAEVAAKLQSGEVTMNNLAFVEGLLQWTPLRDVLARVDAAGPPPTPMPGLPPPVAIPTQRPGTFPSARYSYAATMEPPPELAFAGFWLRVAAILIDALVLTLPNGILCVIFFVAMEALGGPNFGTFEPGNSDNINPSSLALIGGLELILGTLLILIGWLYHAILESGRWQGTIGKHVLKLRVTGLDGNPIGFWRATGRYFSKVISALPFDIGFLMAAFTARKQALHDMIVGTLVVRS